MPSALVTGGTGFIASRLVPALLDGGWEVRACGRRPRPPASGAERPGGMVEAVDYRRADLADDHQDLRPLFDGVTHLFHLAGASSSQSSQEEMERSNVAGTARLLAAAPPGLERVVHMSSTSVYGEEEQLPVPVTEDVEPHPSRGYGKAKWQGEQVVWDHGRRGLPVTVLRPVSVHGPGSIKLLASVILDVAVERYAGNTRLPVPTPAIEQRLVHVDDLIGACLHLAVHGAAVGRAFNVVSGVYPTSQDVAALVAAEFDMEVDVVDDPDAGPSYDERAEVRERMLAEGMEPHILLTEQRFRFMRKANRNNRLSIDALLGTGFRPALADVATAVRTDVAWYRQHHWII